MRTIQIAFVGLVAATAGAEPPVVAIRQDPRSVDVGAWILEKVPQPRSVYEALLARGVTQHVQLDKTHIPMALALQAAGSPVIVMEGQGGRWPATLAGDVSVWGHRFDPGYPAPRTVLPCLMWLDAARVQAGGCHDRRGVDGLGRRPHGRLEVALATEEVFRQWRGQYWMDLVGAYLGAPVKEVYPAAEVTNWMLTVSTPQVPLRYWNDRHHRCAY